MNIKLRFQNKTTLVALITLAISIVYTILGMFNVVPPVSQEQIVNVALMIIELLVVLGVVTDPSTKGILDPPNVQEYEEPRDWRQDKLDELMREKENDNT